MISVRLAVLLLWWTQTCSCRSLPMDGEAFLLQEMGDAVTFRNKLKDMGIELPVRPNSTGTVQAQLQQRNQGLSEQTERPRHMRQPRKQRTGVAADGIWAEHNAARASMRAAGCERLFWTVPVHRAWNAPEAERHLLYTRLQVALLSARIHAPSLVPVLVWDGPPDAFTAWWEITGGTLVFATATLYPHLATCQGSWQESAEHAARCRASYLLLDLPELLGNLSATAPRDVSRHFALATSPDVLLLKDVDTCALGRPPLLALGRDHQDSGGLSVDVMYANLAALANARPRLVAAARVQRFQAPNCVQGLLLSVLDEGRELGVLPNRVHWKGYWGGSTDVAMVQFYGPKPMGCLPCLVEFPDDPSACEARCDATALAMFRFTGDGGVYYKWLLHVYWAFVDTPVRFVEYQPRDTALQAALAGA